MADIPITLIEYCFTMVRRTHTIGVVLRSHPETACEIGFRDKAIRAPADIEIGPAMTTNPEAHGMDTRGGP